jgi:hypothetical protein
MKIKCTPVYERDAHLADTFELTPELLAKITFWNNGLSSDDIVRELTNGHKVCTAFCEYTRVRTAADPTPDYMNAYCKLTRIAVATDRSEMTAAAHREFMTIICRAQQILRLEALQAGFPDFETLPTTR